MDRFTFTEPDMRCETCGKGPDECDAAYYADAVCVEAEETAREVDEVRT